MLVYVCNILVICCYIFSEAKLAKKANEEKELATSRVQQMKSAQEMSAKDAEVTEYY